MTYGIEFISVDMQNDFATRGGICFENRPSVKFVRNELIPFLYDREILINEIISDYRQPRKGDSRFCCRPGKWGFESIIPVDLIKGDRWIKSMNDPTWIRKNGGNPEREPGEPYQNTERFDQWILNNIGDLDEVDMVILFGLTADRCVLCTAQQLTFRGYDVRVLSEATDMTSGNATEKMRFLENPPFTFWGRSISYLQLKQIQ